MRSDMYELHHELEHTHWWFTARRRIIMGLLRRAAGQIPRPPGDTMRIADVGCGTGGMLQHLAELGRVTGVDTSPEAVAYATAADLDVRLGALPDQLPFAPDEKFHIVTLLDVLEHIEDDVAALQAIRRYMVPGGILGLTVPAGQYLWTSHDLANFHFRRYSRPQLAARLREAGLRVEYLSYYNTALFPPIAAVRLLHRVFPPSTETHDFRMPPGPVNRLFHEIFAAERFLVGRMQLPFGISLIGVAVNDGNV